MHSSRRILNFLEPFAQSEAILNFGPFVVLRFYQPLAYSSGRVLYLRQVYLHLELLQHLIVLWQLDRLREWISSRVDHRENTPRLAFLSLRYYWCFLLFFVYAQSLQSPVLDLAVALWNWSLVIIVGLRLDYVL